MDVAIRRGATSVGSAVGACLRCPKIGPQRARGRRAGRSWRMRVPRDPCRRDSSNGYADRHPAKHADLPALRIVRDTDDADRRVHFLLRLPELRRAATPEGRQLLRVLVVRHAALSADSRSAFALQAATLRCRQATRALAGGLSNAQDDFLNRSVLRAQSSMRTDSPPSGFRADLTEHRGHGRPHSASDVHLAEASHELEHRMSELS